MKVYKLRSAVFFTAVLVCVAALSWRAHSTSPGPPPLGLPVFAADGIKVGWVSDVSVTLGRVDLIRILTGSTLGFGERVVEIPQSEFTMRSGSVVLLHLRSDDVAALPTAASENNGPRSEER
jgi:PRC-barrel domain